ncbi:MAG: hypothetical protein ACI8Y3_000241 [Paraglaciecola sp.]
MEIFDEVWLIHKRVAEQNFLPLKHSCEISKNG